MVHKQCLTCHKTGESAVATGAEGADGVCVLMMYCSGAAYLKGRDCTHHGLSMVGLQVSNKDMNSMTICTKYLLS